MLRKIQPSRDSFWRRHPRLPAILVLGGTALALLLGGNASGNLKAALTFDSAAFETIKNEVVAVQQTRADYYEAIGRENGGAYDQHETALRCPEKLAERLQAAKELKSEYVRLTGEIRMREREQLKRGGLIDLETKAKAAADEILSPAELEAIKTKGEAAKLAFEQVGAKLEVCVDTYSADSEKCELIFVEWVAAQENLQDVIFEIAGIIEEKKIEVERKTMELETEAEKNIYQPAEQNSNNLSAFLGRIQAENLKALGLGFLNTGADFIGKGVGEIVGAPLGALGAFQEGLKGVLGGGQDAVAKKYGTNAKDLKEFLAGAKEATTVFDGPGLEIGLQAFAQSYKGNKYGSALGMIIGWTNFMLPFVGALAIAALVYAGFLFITAAGNQEQTDKAKKIIIWVVVGIIVIFSAYALVNTLISGNSSYSETSVDVNVGGLGFSYSK